MSCPLVAVAFDLLTTGPRSARLWLLFGGTNPLARRPRLSSTRSRSSAIFAAVFGITAVYEVALLQRTREAFLRGGDAHAGGP